jgi:multiple sugar transport system permease protein
MTQRAHRIYQLKKHALRLLINAGCIIIGLFWLLPFGWILSTSMRKYSEAFRIPPAFFPERIDFGNYVSAFMKVPFLNFAINSLIVSVSAVAIMLVITAMSAYAFARIDFKYKKVALPILISGMMIPGTATLIPMFFMMRDLGLMDNRWAVILVGVYFPIGLLLMRQFIMTIPRSYDEAAYIDGAGRVQIFFKIILPMSTQVIIVAALLCFITNWNNFIYPLIFLNDIKKFTLPLGLQFLRSMYYSDVPAMLAGVVVTLIIPALIYMFLHKYLVKGIITTGLKV